MRKALVISSIVLAAALAGVACDGLPGFPLGGGTGESPVAAFLPDSVSLDVSELPDDDPNAKSKNDAAHLAMTPYSRALHAAARIVFDFHRLADKGLALGARIRHDMTDPSQTQVSGHFLVAGQQIPYKADFAAFDIDGDGTTDGSGNAVDVPVALRVWVDRGNGFGQFLCALVTTKPTPGTATGGQMDGSGPPPAGNLGAGQLYVKPGAAVPDAPGDFQAYVIWDRTDDAHKWNEAFTSGHLRDGLSMPIGHQRVDVRTNAAGEVEKTVRAATDFGDNPFGLQTYQASVHFKRGSHAALISAQATGGGGSININNQCVLLPDVVLASNGECDGFDTQDMAFIDLPAGGETDFPADFPATPTF